MQKQSLRFLPANKNPSGTRCIQITIPDDDDWERDLYSEMSRLGIWALWERDTGKNGAKVARLWRQAFKTWTHCQPCPPMTGIGAESEETMIRQNPANPCQLQSSVDGQTWCTFADFSLCVPSTLQNSFQPGSAQTPPPGGCTEFDVTLFASGKYLLPIGVGGGDTVTITSLTGAWNDGGTPNWYCPDGHYYALGFCGTAGQHTDSGDPCNSLFHMSLIASDGTNCYDAASGSFTINSGIADGSQLVFQANDSGLSNNSGSVSFHVKICKNAVPVSFYYGLATDFYIAGGHPEDIQYTPINLGTSYTVTSKVPDGASPTNKEAFFVLSFATGFNSGNDPINPLPTWFKLTELSISGATLDSGDIYNYQYGSGCSGSGTASGQTATAPTLPQNMWNFQIRSYTQFVIRFTIDTCS